MSAAGRAGGWGHHPGTAARAASGRLETARAAVGHTVSALAGRVDRLPGVATFLLVVVPLLALYLASATYGPTQSPDPRAAATTAWQLTAHGNITLDAFEGDNPWFVRAGGRVVSDRQPGVAVFALPFYGLAGASPADGLSYAPAGVAAAVAAALAMGTLHLSLRRLAPPSGAVAAAYVAGLGTATWSVSADALWPHGPDQLWLAIALLALAAGRWAVAGAGLGLVVLARPHAAVVPLVCGLWEARHRRAWRPAAVVGAVSALGVAALVAYNHAVYGGWSISGGYGSEFTDKLVGATPFRFDVNVLGALVTPDRGILLHSPFLLALIPGLRRAWRAAPSWVRAAAVAGAAYTLLNLRMNRFSGGVNFYSYRYPLEGLTLAAPLLVLSYRQWVRERAWRRRMLAALVAASIAVQGLGAFAWSPRFVARNPWTASTIAEAALEAGGATTALLVTCVAVVYLLAGRRAQAGRGGVGAGQAAHDARRHRVGYGR
ncbi:MAG: hypothetical protein KY434_08925 [Actinobacteria bacterium]|nr:hypothetical protein [Actinomycetota bacterium]